VIARRIRLPLAGVFTALATPFRPGFSLDMPAFRRLLRRQAAAGVEGVVIGGSTGEGSALEPGELAALIRAAIAEAGDMIIIAGVGVNNTAAAVRLAQRAQSAGAQALLVTAPSYNKPPQRGIAAHYSSISRATKIPIIIYNIPGRTAVNIEPETVARMAREIPRIIAVKESSGSLDQASEILRLAPPDFSLLAGDDSLILPMLSVGARGAVSVLSNLAPANVAELYRAALGDDFRRAREIHLRMLPAIKALYGESNPIPLKAALALAGLSRDILRPPLVPLAPEKRALLKKRMRDFGEDRRPHSDPDKPT
jgi:4-hydroxy-tetrahydrodipicolinate synthase